LKSDLSYAKFNAKLNKCSVEIEVKYEKRYYLSIGFFSIGEAGAYLNNNLRGGEGAKFFNGESYAGVQWQRSWGLRAELQVVGGLREEPKKPSNLCLF